MTPHYDPSSSINIRSGLRRIAAAALLIMLILATSVFAQTGADAEAPFDASTTLTELLDKAHAAVSLEEWQLAESYYQEILIRDRSHLVAMLELSNVYERVGRLEYARGLLIRAATIDPNNASIGQRQEQVEQRLGVLLSNEAEAFIAAEQFEQAIPKIALHMSFSSGNAKLHFNRAICLTALDQFDAALADIDAAIQIDPQNSYFEFRSEIVASQATARTQHLSDRIKRLAASSSELDWEKGLTELSTLIALEPENEWARETFTRLTDQLAAGKSAETIEPVSESDEARANPATTALANGSGWVASLVQKHLGTFLIFVGIFLIFRSPLSKIIIKKFSAQPLLSGQLVPFSLPEILLMLNAEPHNGVLQVRGKSCKGKVFIEGGEPCHCAVGKMTGVEALTYLLNNCESGSFVFKEGTMSINRTIDNPLSMVLIENARETTEPQRPAESQKKSRMKELLDSQV